MIKHPLLQAVINSPTIPREEIKLGPIL